MIEKIIKKIVFKDVYKGSLKGSITKAANNAASNILGKDIKLTDPQKILLNRLKFKSDRVFVETLGLALGVDDKTVRKIIKAYKQSNPAKTLAKGLLGRQGLLDMFVNKSFNKRYSKTIKGIKEDLEDKIYDKVANTNTERGVDFRRRQINGQVLAGLTDLKQAVLEKLGGLGYVYDKHRMTIDYNQLIDFPRKFDRHVNYQEDAILFLQNLLKNVESDYLDYEPGVSEDIAIVDNLDGTYKKYDAARLENWIYDMVLSVEGILNLTKN